MRFVHYTDCPSLTLETLRSDYQQPVFENKDISHDKPQGLWLSDDDEEYYNWRSWCEREDFHKGALRYAYLATLDFTDLLHIKNLGELVNFHMAYYTEYSPDNCFINWQAVAQSYKGIIISPYLPDVSMKFDFAYIWYWGWDVACACIWDKSAIKSFEKIKGGSNHTEREHETV